MSNRGLTNHFKFKTKYWQDRQRFNLSQLESTVVQGVKMQSPPPLNRPHSRNKRLKMNLQAKPRKQQPPSMRYTKNTKTKLKMELLELDRDNLGNFQQFRTIDTHRTLSEKNRYRGFTAQEKRQTLKTTDFRPQTSLTIEVKAPGSKSFLMRQKLQLLEKKGVGGFMPLHSSICYSARTPYCS